MSAQGPRPKSVEALNAATRVYNDAVMAFGHEPDSLEWMRQQLREFSSVPLMLMISRPFGRTLEFFPELILNLCQAAHRASSWRATSLGRCPSLRWNVGWWPIWSHSWTA